MPNGKHYVGLAVQASNQYQFAGGNQGNGNCKNEAGAKHGAAPVQITLLAPDGYTISSVTLFGTGVDQMQANVTGKGQAAVISNPCTAVADVDYTVNVQTADGINIPCHPKIVNT